MRRRCCSAVLVLALASGTAGCAAPPEDGGASTTPGAGTTVTGSPTGTAYQSVADLSKALGQAGLTCTLQYPGLRDDITNAELSICTIDGDQAYLRVWGQPAAIQAFLQTPEATSGTVAVGANWTVSLTSPASAQRVAVALGGLVPTSSTTAPTTTTSTEPPA